MPKDRNVFLSYDFDDQSFADELRKAMIGYHVHILDPLSDVKAGEDYSIAISQEIIDSDLFVFIVPQKEGSGKSSLFELGAAKALGKRIVAVLPDSKRAANTEVAARLADFVLVDAESKSTSEIAKKILEKAA